MRFQKNWKRKLSNDESLHYYLGSTERNFKTKPKSKLNFGDFPLKTKTKIIPKKNFKYCNPLTYASTLIP